MNILFVLENFYPKIGGVETLFLKLASALVDKGNKVYVFTSGAEGLPSQQSYQGIEIIRTRYSNRYLFTFFTWFKCIRLASHADIIHTTSYNAAVPAIIAAHVNKKKSIITFHEAWTKLWFKLPNMSAPSKLLHYLFEQWILSFRFSRFIAVSKFTQQALIDAGIKEAKVQMIYNGLNYDEYHVSDQKETSKAYLYYGRVGVSKGIHLILEALAILKQKGKAVLLDLIVSNDKQSRKHLQQIIDSLDIKNHVRLIDQMEFQELKTKVRQAKAVIIPSYSEGFCFVAAESVALGTNIISSGRGALKEVVGGHYLEMQSQTAEDLARCIEQAEKDDWQYREPKTFYLQDTVDQYIRAYNNLLNG